MTIKTNIKAGSRFLNHNETETTERTRSLKIKSGVKAGPSRGGGGGWLGNHNETQADVRSAVARSRGFSVKTGVKAGPTITVQAGSCDGRSRS